jgi:tetratricopeptide (TPR) repeat protein
MFIMLSIKVVTLKIKKMEKISFSYTIEKYLAGELTGAEKEIFEKKIREDKSLQSEVNLRRRVDRIIETRDVQSLRNKLSVIEKSRVTKKRSLQPQFSTFLKYAAVFTGIVLIAGISLFSGTKLASDQIIDRYYKVYEPVSGQRSEKVSSDEDFIVALSLYNTHEYGKAAIFFSKVLEKNPEDMQSELLNGLSNFEEKQYPEAKKSFGIVIEDNNNFFVETAKWYLALCYVETGENEKARQLLEVIAKEGGIYKKDATKIIRKYK